MSVNHLGTLMPCATNVTCGQGDVDPLLQSPPQRLVNVPGEIGGSEDHHHLRGVVIVLGSSDAWLKKNTQRTVKNPLQLK